MPNVYLSKGSLYEPELVNDLFNKVHGKSSLAVLCSQTPVPFNGSKEFAFTFDNEMDIVAEGGQKTHGGISLTPITILPIKFEYGARVSDEFMYASEEAQLDIVKAFNDGFAAKLARALDIAALHGVNPRTMTTSTVVGGNCFDTKITQAVEYYAETADTCIEDAVAVVEAADYEANGLILSPSARQDMAKIKANGIRQYPEFAFGQTAANLGGMKVDVNTTVTRGAPIMRGYVGDFSCFKWGYSKEIPFQVIEYGDPDNSGYDLKGYNQVYLRAEAYLGWAIMDVSAFAKLVSGNGITLDRYAATIAVNGTVTLTATKYPAESTVTWTSSDATVASVNNGVVTALKAGETVITAAITVDGKTYKTTCAITVE